MPTARPPDASLTAAARRELEAAAADEVDVDVLVLEEATRATLLVLPFLVPTLALIWVIVGQATRAVEVRAAFGTCLALLIARWAALRWIPRVAPKRGGSPWRNRALSASTWLMSAGFAGIYFSVGPHVDAVQLLTLAIVATAVCALAILSASAGLFTYIGYVSIHLGALAIVIVRHADAALTPTLPAMIVFFVVVLTLVAKKNNASLREKLALSLQVRDFGLRDALTGLRNRAFVEIFTEQRARQLVEQLQLRGRRQPNAARRLALLLVDIDHFKKINDKHGHAAGDQVLASFAKVARSAVRAGDIVARWGGEEFLVVMEVEDAASAKAVAERLRTTVSATPVSGPGGRPIDMTCSVGACLFPFDPSRPDALTWQETLELADGALYRSKARGRNRTTWMHPDPDFTPRQLLQQQRESDAETLRFRKAS
ncbi:MAG: histidine kinase [Labilithrix sp.]|nr:histidine kinase [Labilithrix sp.]